MSLPIFTIGVSGHQDLGDNVTRSFVANQFRELLRTYQQYERQIILYAALARGADQLFVQIALEAGIPVEVILPCEDYEAIFPDEADRNAYNALLQQSQSIHRLPPKQCSDDAYLAAGQWIVDHSHLMILAWNGQPAKGRSGTGDVANYARTVQRPFIHIHTRQHCVTTYGNIALQGAPIPAISPKREFATSKHIVYQGPALAVNRYHIQMPDGTEIIRDIAERPESVLVLPVSTQDIILLIEEYDLGAGIWQLKLPGGKIERELADAGFLQAQKELRQEIGYRAGKLEKLVSFYSHPGYMSHRVHVFVAQDLEWNPLEMDPHEQIKIHTYTLQEALAETTKEYRCDPEAALALWLYAQKRKSF